MPKRAFRAPFPYDMVIGSTGVVLGVPKSGAPLIAARPQDLAQVAPPEFGYSAASPIVERVHSYGDLTGGFGQAIQSKSPDTRYSGALGVDTSLGQPWIKGPLVTTVTPGTVDATNGITGFFEVGGTLYALNGRYCLYRANDATISVSHDFGAAKVATDAIVFYSNGLAQSYAYVAMGDSELMYRFDATSTTTNWVQHATLYARAFATVGREFWRANGVNNLAKVDTDADPWIAGNWTPANSFSIGDKSSPIQRLTVAVGSTLIVLKSDGVYDLDADGFDHNLYPSLKFGTLPDDGKIVGTWQGDLYLAYGKGLYRIKPTLTFSTMPHLPITEIGPERLTDNASPLRGRITAVAGHDNFCLYAGLYNDDTGNSYLLKFGAFAKGPDGAPANVETWHGSITTTFTGKKIQTLYVSTIGAPSGHKRLYLGFSDGTIAYFTLPCTSNPAACTSYVFTHEDGKLFFSFWDAEFRNDPKLIKAATLTGLSLSTTAYCSLLYSVAPSVPYAGLGLPYVTFSDTNGNPLYFTQGPTQKVNLPSATTGTLFAFAVQFISTDGTTPQLTGLGIHYAVRPPLALVYEFDVLLAANLARRDGSVYRSNPDDLRDMLKNAAKSAGPILVTLPDETQKWLMIVGYQERQAFQERSRRWYGSAHLSAADAQSDQDTLVPIYGTWDRVSQYTWNQLASYTWNQLGAL